MPLDRHISVFAEPAFEPRNVLSLRGETTTTPLSPKISPADKLAHCLGLPDNTGDGVRSPKSRMSTLSV